MVGGEVGEPTDDLWDDKPIWGRVGDLVALPMDDTMHFVLDMFLMKNT